MHGVTVQGVTMQSKKYKGVPYITANPHRRRLTPTNPAAVTAVDGKEDGQQVHVHEHLDAATKGTEGDVEGGSSSGASRDSVSAAATPQHGTAAATPSAPIDPPKSKDAAVIV